MQMVHQREDGTFDHMQPVLDTNGMEWVAKVDDLPTVCRNSSSRRQYLEIT